MRELLLVVAIALGGCAGGPPLKKINGETISIKEKIRFSAIAGVTPGIRHYHALLPGPYTATYEDPKGTYYFGDGMPIVLAGREKEDGATEEPLAEGGFWLAKDEKALPAVELFYLPGSSGSNHVMIDGVVQNHILTQGQSLSIAQAGVAGGLGTAIAGAMLESQSFRMIRGGPRFVPLRDVPAEKDALLNAMKNGRR